MVLIHLSARCLVKYNQGKKYIRIEDDHHRRK